MTHREILEKGKAILESSGITEHANDAWLLFEFAFNINRTMYFVKNIEEADEDIAYKYFDYIDRRAKHEPLQYITGSTCFMGLDFKVTPDVLIPRFDTEVLLENVMKHIKKEDRVLDICTGSGCIAISLAKLTGCSVTAADISEKALLVAEDNNISNGTNVIFIQSDMFKNVTGCFDYIVSNPPYIRTADIYELDTEVKDNEPFLALDGHEDGLAFYRILAKEAGKYLKASGGIFLEIGYDQGEAVSELLRENNFDNISMIKDLAGLDRVVCGFKSNT